MWPGEARRSSVGRIEALRSDLRVCEATARVIGRAVSPAPPSMERPRRAASSFAQHDRPSYRLLVVSRRLQEQRRLPGGELVEKGLSDLAAGVVSAESLLVSIGAPRLRRLGFDVSSAFADPEERLYLLLAREEPNGAHSRYNALVRRLVSFERAAESAR